MTEDNKTQYDCPDCDASGDYIVHLSYGDEDGQGSYDLYQCRKCKKVWVVYG